MPNTVRTEPTATAIIITGFMLMSFCNDYDLDISVTMQN